MKFDACSMSPVPLYFATFGYAQSGRVRAGDHAAGASALTPPALPAPRALASGASGAWPFSTHLTSGVSRRPGGQHGVRPRDGSPARSRAPALHYSVREPANGKRPRHTVVLSHALGCDLSMWDGLARLLAADCRVITYDHRGHGSSDGPEGPYSMADLADDAARLLRELDTGLVVWVGLSMGGMVGQELALRHPALVAALVLANTTSTYPEAARAARADRSAAVNADGMTAIAESVMARYFHERFRAGRPSVVARYRERLVTTDVAGYVGCCAAVASVDTTARLGKPARPVASHCRRARPGDAGGHGAGARGRDSRGHAHRARRRIPPERGRTAGGVQCSGAGVHCGSVTGKKPKEEQLNADDLAARYCRWVCSNPIGRLRS